MRKADLKKMFSFGKGSKQAGLGFFAAAAALLLSAAASFAWFMGSISGTGAEVSTGRIRLSFSSYKLANEEVAGSRLLRFLHESEMNSRGSVELGSMVQGSLGSLSAERPRDEVYFLVEKQDGSIPLDVQLALDLTGLDGEDRVLGTDGDLTYAGGLWFKLQDITDAVAAKTESELSRVAFFRENGSADSEAATLTERKLYSYMATAPEVPESAGRSFLELSQITQDNRSAKLQNEGRFCLFRLTLGLREGAQSAAQYLGREYSVKVTLTAAQVDGLLLHGSAETYYVSNSEELNYCLGQYKPGDDLVFTDSFTYLGDLVFTRPVNLYLAHSGAGHCLTVAGNLVFSYAYRDSFNINTAGGGRIIVKRCGDGSAVSEAGGNFDVDLPLASLILTGSNDTALGKADIYVQGRFDLKASLPSDGSYDRGSTAYGLVVTRCTVMDGIGLSADEPVRKPITLGSGAQITVSAGSAIGQIMASEQTEQLVLLNYGTVAESVNLSAMYRNLDPRTASERHIPQIFIDNYGQLERMITLPANSLPFDAASLTGNTRIIREHGATDMGVDDTVRGFKTANIEKVTENVHVLDVDGDGKNLRVYYTVFEQEQAEDVTLASILNEHISHCHDAEGSFTKTHTEALSDIVSLEVITGAGKVLTDGDYALLRQLSSLTRLDLSAADTAGDAVPERAFRGISGLKNLSLPNEARSLGAYAVENTSVTDLYLPYRMMQVANNALRGVQYVHPRYNGDSPVANLRQDRSDRYIFVPAEMLDAYRSSYTVNHQLLFREAVLSEDGNYFYRLVSSNLCQIAAWVGLPYIQTSPGGEPGGSTVGTFDFSVMKRQGEEYRICGFDDYAFYQKLARGTSDLPLLSLEFSPALAEVGMRAFCDGTALEALHFSSETECSLGSYAFWGCSRLREVGFAGVVSVGEYGFAGCSSLTALDLPDMRSLGKSCFQNCSGVTRAEAPALKYAGAYCFQNCSSLYFACCPRLDDLGWYDTYFSYLFDGCTSLLALETGMPGQAIAAGRGKSAYRNTALKLAVVHTEYESESRNTNFTAVENGEAPADSAFLLPSLGRGGADFYALTGGNRRFDTGSFEASSFVYGDQSAYTGAGAVLRASVTVNGEVKYLSDCGLGDYVFALKEDGTAALLYCALKRIEGRYTLPDRVDRQGQSYTVTEVWMNAFRDVTFVNTELTVPACIRSLGSNAFAGKSGLSALRFAEGGSYALGSRCFYKSGLTRLQLAGTSSLGSYAFAECAALYRADLSGAEFLGDHCFSGCAALTLADFSGVQTVGDSGFAGCLSLADLALPDVRSLGNSCFSGCSAALTLRAPQLEFAGAYCFQNCSSLYLAFCPRLETLGYTENHFTYTFDGCTKLLGMECGMPGQTGTGVGYYTYRNTSLKLAVIHTETDSGCTNTNFSTLDSNRGSAPGDAGFLLPSRGRSNMDFYASVPGPCRFDSGCYEADDYAYADHSDCAEDGDAASVERAHVFAGGQERYLSDCGLGDYVFGLNGDGTACLLYCALKRIEGDYTVPDHVDAAGRRYTVTAIGAKAFRDVTLINVKMTVPASVAELAPSALSGKAGLREIWFTPGTDYILGENAFSGCAELRRAVFAGGTLGSELRTRAFFGCSGLETADFTGVGSIGDECFSGCTKLAEADLKEVREAGYAAFQNCTGLVRVRGDRVERLGHSCFSGCTDLTVARFMRLQYFSNITGSGVTDSSVYTFRNCNKLLILETSLARTPDKTQGYYSIGTTKLWLVHGETAAGQDGKTGPLNETLGNVTIILPQEAADYVSLVSASRRLFTEGYGIAGYAWARETSDCSVTRPGSSVGGEVLTLADVGCGDYLLGLNGDGTASLLYCSLSSISGVYRLPERLTVQTGDGDREVTVTAVGSSAFRDVVMNGVDLTVPASVTVIGASAFQNRSGLSGLSFEAGTCSLESSAFSGCVGLTRVSFPAGGCFTLGTNAFLNCTSLQSAVFAGSTEVGNTAFKGCTALKTLELSGVSRIGTEGFSGCTALREIRFPGETVLGTKAFMNCSSLLLAEGPLVRRIGDYCFQKCSRLVAARFPGLCIAGTNGTSSGAYTAVFEGCTGLIFLETGLVATEANAEGHYFLGSSPSKSLVLWVNHTETPREAGGYYKLYRQESQIPANVTLLLADPEGDTDYDTLIAGSKKLLTGNYTADRYAYVNEANADVTRTAVTFGTETYTPGSSLVGAGDYVFGLDPDGESAALLFCTLKEIGGSSYTLPSAFSWKGRSYRVTAVGERAFDKVTFTVSELVIPSTVERIGANAFGSAASVQRLVLRGNDRRIDAGALFGTRSFGSSFKVLVSPYALSRFYTPEAGDWGGISPEHFVSSGISYQPESGGPVFILEEYREGYRIEGIEAAAGRSELVIPGSYTDGRPILKLCAGAFPTGDGGAITVIRLPAELTEFCPDLSMAPENLAAYTVAAENPCFTARDGVLYRTRGSILVNYPRGKAGESFTLPETVEALETGAFCGTRNLREITVPRESRLSLAEGSLAACSGLESLRFLNSRPSRFLNGCFLDLPEGFAIYVPADCGPVYRYALSGNAWAGDRVRELEHRLSYIPATPAACLEEGCEARWTCALCGRSYFDAQGSREILPGDWDSEMRIPASGHSFGEAVLYYPEAEGPALACSRCLVPGCDGRKYELIDPAAEGPEEAEQQEEEGQEIPPAGEEGAAEP